MARLDSGTPAAACLACRTKAPHQPQANQPWHAQCPGPRTRPVEQVPAKCSCNTSFPIKWCVQVRAGARLGVPSDGIAAPSGRVFLRGHTPGIRRRGAQGLPIPTFAVLVLSNLALIQTNRSWASVSRESTASLAGSSAGSPWSRSPCWCRARGAGGRTAVLVCAAFAAVAARGAGRVSSELDVVRRRQVGISSSTHALRKR